MSTEPAPAEAGQAPTTTPIDPAPSASDALSAFGELTDDQRGYIENKKWTKPADMIDGYKNLESFRGVPEDRLLKLPADPSEMGAVWDRLGRPEAADKYTLALPEELKDGVYDRMSAKAHEAGLTDAQFSALQTEFAEVSQALITERAESVAADFENWKASHDAEFQNVRTMLQAVGVSDNDIAEAMNGSSAAFYGTLAKVAARMAEGKMVDGGEGDQPSFVMTPAAARAKIEALNADPDFQARLNHADAKVRIAAAEERRKFYEIATRGEAQQQTDVDELRRENARLTQQLRSGIR